ncbi:hypothetical protein TYRP_014482 [Tyrophagus putrescentiae]|nr:hypothetical protein TYRP_014482 [Tyrophagus putrescentiae]
MKVFAVALYARTPTHLPYKRVYVRTSDQARYGSQLNAAVAQCLPVLVKATLIVLCTVSSVLRCFASCGQSSSQSSSLWSSGRHVLATALLADRNQDKASDEAA